MSQIIIGVHSDVDYSYAPPPIPGICMTFKGPFEIKQKKQKKTKNQNTSKAAADPLLWAVWHPSYRQINLRMMQWLNKGRYWVEERISDA